jgi:hypothetical protein
MENLKGKMNEIGVRNPVTRIQPRRQASLQRGQHCT